MCCGNGHRDGSSTEASPATALELMERANASQASTARVQITSGARVMRVQPADVLTARTPVALTARVIKKRIPPPPRGGQVLPSARASHRVPVEAIVTILRVCLCVRPCDSDENVSVMSLFTTSARCPVAQNATMMVWFSGLPGQNISLRRFLCAAKKPDESSRRWEPKTSSSLTDARRNRPRVRGQRIDQPRR
jgi:hypothetical protein